MKRLLVKLFRMCYPLLCHFIPLDRHCIVFESNMGNNYTGSPRAIYEAFVARGLDEVYSCNIILKQPGGVQLPGKGKIIKRRSIAYFLTFARASVWISDSRMPLYLVKKRGVTYIQTWHGTPLKKLALDMDSVSMAGTTDLATYKENFRKNTRTWDYLVSQNPYSTEIFRRCFDLHKEILEIGYPRCDVLFSKNNPDDIRDIKTSLGIPLDKRVLLYAPTWRDDSFYGKGHYKFESPLDIALLQRELGKHCVLLVKYHYLVADQIDWSPYEGFVYNFSRANDIAPLYLIADAMITDYSSVMFDYSILNRPMYFFCYDLEKYRDELRGFYFDFEKKAPGPLVTTTRELLNAMALESQDLFRERREAFRETFVSKETGTASDQIVDLITSL